MIFDFSILGESDAITTHAQDHVFTEDDNVLCAILDSTWIAGKDGFRYMLGQTSC